MIHIGFTGTRRGMTTAQLETVRHTLLNLIDYEGPAVVHHGACVGADAQFHEMCRKIPNVLQIHQHIPTDTKLRANLLGGIHEFPLPYKERNQAIVNASDWVIAAPLEREPQIRGGTWQTIRFAQVDHKLWRIVFTDGTPVRG